MYCIEGQGDQFLHSFAVSRQHLLEEAAGSGLEPSLPMHACCQPAIRGKVKTCMVPGAEPALFTDVM
jgi:hypothetical protein